METSVDWPCVDLLVSDLNGVFDPHADGETIQEALGVLETKREEMKNREESKREMIKGILDYLCFLRRNGT